MYIAIPTAMEFRQKLSETFIMTAGSVPSLTIAFGTELAVESQGACGGAVMNAAEPSVSITVN